MWASFWCSLFFSTYVSRVSPFYLIVKSHFIINQCQSLFIELLVGLCLMQYLLDYLLNTPFLFTYFKIKIFKSKKLDSWSDCKPDIFLWNLSLSNLYFVAITVFLISKFDFTIVIVYRNTGDFVLLNLYLAILLNLLTILSTFIDSLSSLYTQTYYLWGKIFLFLYLYRLLVLLALLLWLWFTLQCWMEIVSGVIVSFTIKYNVCCFFFLFFFL